MKREPWQTVRDEWPFDGCCPECRRLHNHEIDCSLAPHEYRVWKIKAIQRKLMFLKDKNLGLARAAIMWEGKFRIVKHENNQLRRKLFHRGEW